MASYTVDGTYVPITGLVGGLSEPISRIKTIASGAGVLEQYTVLGKITASGKLVAASTALSNGAEVAYAVLAAQVDATSADAEAVVWLSGTFKETDLIFVNGSDTVDDFFDHLRAVGIYCLGAS